MSRLLIFNCSNDMALACGADEYMPPKSVARMEETYALLPSFVAEQDDVVLRPSQLSVHNGFAGLCKSLSEPVTAVCPWGWSKPIRNKLRRFGVPDSMLPDDHELDMLRRLSSRQFGAEYAGHFYDCVPDAGISTSLVGNKMVCAMSPDGLRLTAGRYIAKLLWSSSGRGNRVFSFTDGKDVPIMKYPVLIDIYYNKVSDFAMEFNVAADHVEYLGLSVFKTDGTGRYELNYVESQESLTRRIQQSMQRTFDATETLLSQVRDIHLAVLDGEVVGKYQGPLGIDMMVVDDGGKMKVHPVVELNFRMNMGIMALMAFGKYGDKLPLMSLESISSSLLHVSGD